MLDAVAHRVRLTTIEITCDTYIDTIRLLLSPIAIEAFKESYCLLQNLPVRNAEDHSTPLMTLTWNTDRQADEFVKKKTKKFEYRTIGNKGVEHSQNSYPSNRPVALAFTRARSNCVPLPH